jgi:hypothetical protein
MNEFKVMIESPEGMTIQGFFVLNNKLLVEPFTLEEHSGILKT